jgi:hypothetical protein
LARRQLKHFSAGKFHELGCLDRAPVEVEIKAEAWGAWHLRMALLEDFLAQGQIVLERDRILSMKEIQVRFRQQSR